MPRVVRRKAKSRKTVVSRTFLNERQKRFVEEYVIDFNGARAASAAGYSNPNMAVALKKMPAVQEAIEEALVGHSERCELTAQMILEQLVYGVTRDGKDFVDKNGRIITNLQRLPKRVTAMIDSIEQEVSYDDKGDERVKTKLRLVSKATCIDLAMKHKGLLAPERHEHRHLSIDLTQLYQSQEYVKDEATLRLEQEALLCEPESESTNLPAESNGSNSRPRPSGTNGSSPH